MFFCNGVCSVVASAVDAAAGGFIATGGLSGLVCAPLIAAIRPNARIAVMVSDIFNEDLFLTMG
jgi:hypothetical protein